MNTYNFFYELRMLLTGISLLSVGNYMKVADLVKHKFFFCWYQQSKLTFFLNDYSEVCELWPVMRTADVVTKV